MMWQPRSMTTYDQREQAKAIAEVEQLTTTYEEAQQALDKARDALQPPGLIAKASPYDRNHVGRLARAAGVEPLREPRKRAGGKSSG
jgi:hypothetical protein